MRAWRALALVWVLALWSAPAAAIGINAGSDSPAARNDRFASGYVFSSGTLTGPLAPNTNASFIGSGYDWSGVGWNSGSGVHSYALITPRQMVIANHYAPLNLNQPNPQFVSNGGQLTTVSIQSQPGTHPYPIGSGGGSYASDLATAQLSNPISQSAGLTTYSILFQGYNPNTYVGYNLLSYGQTAAIGWNTIAAVGTGTELFDGFGPKYTPDPAYYMEFLYDTTTPDRTTLQSGDSGSPSFMVTGSPGVMYLAGAHYLTTDTGPPNYTPVSGYDTFLPLSLPMLDGDTSPTGYLPSVVTPTTARWISASSSTWGSSGNWSSGRRAQRRAQQRAGNHVRLGAVRRVGRFTTLHHAQR